MAHHTLGGLHGFHDRAQTTRVLLRRVDRRRLIDGRVFGALFALISHVFLEPREFGFRQRRQLPTEQRLETPIHLVDAPSDACIGLSQVVQALLALLKNAQPFHEIGIAEFTEDGSGVLDVAFDHVVFPLDRVARLPRLFEQRDQLRNDRRVPIPKARPTRDGANGEQHAHHQANDHTLHAWLSPPAARKFPGGIQTLVFDTPDTVTHDEGKAMTDSANYTRATTPVFQTAIPSEDVNLYDGPGELLIGPDSHNGQINVRIAWLPVPRLAFRLRLEGAAWVSARGRPTVLVVPDAGIREDVSLAGSGVDARGYWVEGHLKDFASSASGHQSRLMFHLVNFIDYVGTAVCDESQGQKQVRMARLELSSGDWKISIDSVRGLDGQDGLASRLRRTGGYGITHAGMIERTDGNQFDPSTAQPILEDLGMMLTFARGAWCFPQFLVGINSVGQRNVLNLRMKRTAPWKGALSWFDHWEPTSLCDLFPGFLSRRSDPI